jgi:putative FmdB family regulatory protein
MPWYEYKCPNCGKTETEDRKVDDRDNPVTCPLCDNTNMERQISPVPLIGPKNKGNW